MGLVRTPAALVRCCGCCVPEQLPDRVPGAPVAQEVSIGSRIAVYPDIAYWTVDVHVGDYRVGVHHQGITRSWFNHDTSDQCRCERG